MKKVLQELFFLPNKWKKVRTYTIIRTFLIIRQVRVRTFGVRTIAALSDAVFKKHFRKHKSEEESVYFSEKYLWMIFDQKSH